MNLLTLRDLHLNIHDRDHAYHVLRGVNLSVKKGGALGLVGESGSGKTITCLAVMRLLPRGAEITQGQIDFNGKDLARLSQEQMAAVRGRDVCMIFQDARAALNPVLTVGEQIADIYCHRTGKPRAQGMEKAMEVLDAIGIPQARSRVKSYPHELSGGMCQRVLIAMALVSSPQLLIADEITSGLDVTIQTQVIELIKEVTGELEATLVFVSHDIGVIMEACTEIAVMYSGMVLEQGDIDDVLFHPLSPYTKALLECFQVGKAARMSFIPGTAPDLKVASTGCPFAPRCQYAVERCRVEVPLLRELRPSHGVACHEAEKISSDIAAVASGTTGI